MADWAEHSRARGSQRQMLLRITLAVEGGLLAAAAIAGVLFGAPFWSGAAFHAGALFQGTVAGLLLLGLVLTLLEIPSPFSAAIRRDIEPMMGVFRAARHRDLLLIAVLAGAGEEAFFRGFLQQAAAGPLGDVMALLIVSALFGLAHCLSPSYALFAGLLSMPFGIMYTYTGNIVVPMVAHAVYDYAALVYAVQFWKRGGSAT